MVESCMAHIHSKGGKMEKVKVISWTSNNDIKVTTQDGISCKAIYNPINGQVYADDEYERI